MLGCYLMFHGNCAQALDVYVQAFNSQLVEKQTYGDLPPDPAYPVPEQDRDLILHARLLIDGMELMCADSHDRCNGGDNMYVSHTSHSLEGVQKAWDLLKTEAEIYMDLQPTFFAAAHGSLQDRFGINWMFTALRE